MTFRDAKQIAKDTFREFGQGRPFLHGAALSYYAIMALVPLLYLSITYFGLIVGHDTMIEIIASLLREQIGLKDIDGIVLFLDKVDLRSGHLIIEIGGVAALLFSCTAILNSLKKSIDEFYGIDLKKLRGRKKIVKGLMSRLMSLLFILGISILIVAFYFSETLFLATLDRYFDDMYFFTWLLSHFAYHGIPVLMNLIIFSFVFKYLTDASMKWRNAIVGAAVIGLFMYLGQMIIKYYLTHYFFAAGGGVPGTMLIILVWVYYSSQILFLGAKFTAVYARYRGEPLEIK